MAASAVNDPLKVLHPTTSQLEKFCFTFRGHAYEHGIKKRKLNAKITTHPVSLVNYAEYIKSTIAAGRDITRPSITPTPQELAKSAPPSTIKCLIVGLALHGLNLAFERAGKISNVVGDNKPTAIMAKRINSAPYRVVVTMTVGKTIRCTNLFALVHSSDGLSYPFRIPQSDVFYFSEFRDASKTVLGRTVNWMALIRAQADWKWSINNVVAMKQEERAVDQLADVRPDRGGEVSVWYKTASALQTGDKFNLFTKDLDGIHKLSINSFSDEHSSWLENTVSRLKEECDDWKSDVSRAPQTSNALTELDEDSVDDATLSQASSDKNSITNFHQIVPEEDSDDENLPWQPTTHFTPELNAESLASLPRRSSSLIPLDYESSINYSDLTVLELTEDSESGIDL